jgi:hypothetical protein
MHTVNDIFRNIYNYLEKHFHGLALYDGNHEILLRRGPKEGDDRQKAARSGPIHVQCLETSRDDFLHWLGEL